MTYPTPGDYQDALQHPREAFTDATLAAGRPVEGPLGLPRLYTGAFAAVFPVETARGRRAVRCFLADVPQRRARYRALAEWLASAALPYVVAFDYQPEGVRVNGRLYPLVDMAWAEGVGLARWVEAHLDRPDDLRALAAAWRRMLADLDAAGLAHGDLQHGNVLVREGAAGGDRAKRKRSFPEEDPAGNGEPAGGAAGPQTGGPQTGGPQTGGPQTGGPTLRLVDYDAAVVPQLYGRPVPEAGHRNYQHPDRGGPGQNERRGGPWLDRFPGLLVYAALLALADDPGLWARYATGENLLFSQADLYDPDRSPLFAELRDPARPAEVRALAEALRTACLVRPEAVPTLEAVLAGEAPTASAATRRPAAERGAETRRTGLAAAFAPLAVVVGVAAIGLAAAGWPLAALALVVAAAAAAVGWGARAYAALPAVRRRRRLDGEARALARWVADLEAERARLEAGRQAFLDGLDARRAARLAELQDEALGRGLRRHFLAELDAVEGVGHRAVVRLKAAGLRDAHGATPARVAAVRGLSAESRGRIDGWRADLAARYADDVPPALSPAEARRFERDTERRLAGFAREAERLRAQARVQAEEQAALVRGREALAAVTPLAFARWLLRLGPLPQPRVAPAEARPRPAPVQPEPEGAWWEDAA